MAQYFNDDYAEATIDVDPNNHTLSCYFSPDVAEISRLGVLVSLKNTANDSTRIQSRYNFLRVETFNGGWSSANSPGGSVSGGMWHHAGAVFRASNSRSAYLNGTKYSNSTNRNITTGNFTTATIAAPKSSIATTYKFDGGIAEVAIWNIALLDWEMQQLASGFSALTLTHRLANLVVYQDLIAGWNRPGIGATFTTPSVTTVRHPRVIYPSHSAVYLPYRIPGPYAISAAAANCATAESGEVFSPGQVASLVA